MMKLEMINGTYHILENGRDIKDTGTNNKDQAEFMIEDLIQVYGYNDYYRPYPRPKRNK